MRSLLCAALLVGCGGGASSGDLGAGNDLSGAAGDMAGVVNDLAGADLAGDCEMPSGATHYAIGGGSSATKLYRLGDNGWDAELGRIVPKGTSMDLRFDSIAYGSGGIVVSAGAFIYSLSTTPNAMGNYEATNLPDYSGGGHYNYSFTSLYSITSNTYVLMADNVVYCMDLANTYEVGFVATMGYPISTGLSGTCSLSNGGDFTVSFVAQGNMGSRGFSFQKLAPATMATQQSATVITTEKLGGLSMGHSVSDSGSIWSVPTGVDGAAIMKVRDTRLCVGPGNPFNGGKIGGLRGLVW